MAQAKNFTPKRSEAMKDRDAMKQVVLQTKVNAKTQRRLNKIVELYDFGSIYNLLQYVLSAFLHVADPDGEIDEDSTALYEFAKMFEGFENCKKRIVTTRPSGNHNLQLVDSINIYSEIGKRGYVCKNIHVRAEEVRTDANVESAIGIVIKKLAPRTYEHIMSVGALDGEKNIMRIIERIISETPAQPATTRNINEMFAVACGGIEYGRVPKRMRKKSVNDEQR